MKPFNQLLILSKQADEYQRHLEAAHLPNLQILPSLPDSWPAAEIVFGEPDLIAPALAQLPRLKWVQSTWAGIEPLLAPTLRRDYQLTNARGVFGGLMSEFILTYLLLHERKVLKRLAAQKNQTWEPLRTGSLRGKSLGLLGVGSIGAEVARTAKFFGLQVRGYTRASEACEVVDRYFHGAQLLEFANGLDYLVNILPNTPNTRRLVNAELLATLPPTALFINVGRGSAVDESALLTALETGALAGAVLDVFEQEPLPAGHPLWSAPNVFITSHSSAPSFPADLAEVFCANYRRYAAGEPLQYLVDFTRGY
jgi:phosphoglycerate dehydrogenase-like enzyme